jgi:F-type H+-transporting ATPase subunit b
MTWPRRIALTAMALVTAWSVWAIAQPAPRPQPPQPGLPAAPPHRGAEPMNVPPQARPAAAHQAAAAAEGAKGEEEEEKGPAAFNFGEFGGETAPYLAMLINFGILAAGYYLLGKDSIAAGLKARRASIQKELEEAARMKAEAEERAKKYQARLQTLEAEKAMAIEALVRAGEAEKERIVREAEAKAERMKKDAEFLVEQEIKQLRVDVWREAVDTAVAAAEELLKKRVTPADQERLAEEYLADLGTTKTKPATTGGAS